eukprot:831754-Amorphochlora_amoeboformis.AAC.2
MGQCCTIRGGGINGRPSSDIGDKDWGTTDIGPYSSNGTGVPAIRVISTVIVDGRPCKNSLLSFELGNRLQTYERYLNFLTSPTHKGAEEETLEVHG